jgi:hypothetical protein
MPLNNILKMFKPGENIAKGLEIVDQLVTDKDAANRMKAAFYLEELRTKTVPIFDAVHKLGRQILAVLQLVFYAWALRQGFEITPELVLGVSGATGLYTVAKGRGK